MCGAACPRTSAAPSSAATPAPAPGSPERAVRHGLTIGTLDPDLSDTADPDPERVVTEVRDHVLVVTMVREDRRNAVDRRMADALDAAFSRLDDDPGLRAGVLAARGPVFSAGSDLTSGGDYDTVRGGEYGLVRRRRTTPLIAAVDGPALGGGLELALACDLVVASERATFGLPEVRIGLVPTCGALFRGPRQLPPAVARRLVLTGEPIDAQAAHRWGLVTDLCAPGEATATAVRVAGLIASRSPGAVRACLAALDALTDDAPGWDATATAFAAIRDSADATEGVSAFLQKRPPRWTDR